MATKGVIEMDQAAFTIAVLVGITSFFMFTKNLLVSVTKYEPVEKLVISDENESDYDDEDDYDDDDDTDDEMPPLIEHEVPSVEMFVENNELPPLEEISTWVSKDEFSEYERGLQELINTKFDNLQDSILKDVPNMLIERESNLQKEFYSNVELEVLSASVQLEEKIMKNIKEWFLPLHAKKELDTENWQAWVGEKTFDTTTLKIVIENHKTYTHEANDAWVENKDIELSTSYRDSLLSMDDANAWKIEFTNDPSFVNTFKEYRTPEWEGGVLVRIDIKNLKMGSSATSIVQKSVALPWKRVLIPKRKVHTPSDPQVTA